MHQSFLRYKNFLYLKLASGLCLFSLIAYILHRPADPANGGTWLGYTLGTIGAVLILWLLWFGVRKRQYMSNAGIVNAWLSGHVYLGASLIVVATLHCGFQFGWNIHTIAYALTMIVVFSGFYGIYAYAFYPTEITRNRGSVTREAMLAEISELDRESLTLADQVGREAHGVVLKSIEETRLGGNWREQLFDDPARRASGGKASSGLEEMQKRIESKLRRAEEVSIDKVVDTEATAMGFLAGQLDGGAERLERIRRLLDIIQRKRTLVERVQRDIQYHARMAIWLYLHVPLSIGLLGALTAHIITVFFYW
jgi:hypothetical protein